MRAGAGIGGGPAGHGGAWAILGPAGVVSCTGASFENAFILGCLVDGSGVGSCCLRAGCGFSNGFPTLGSAAAAAAEDVDGCVGLTKATGEGEQAECELGSLVISVSTAADTKCMRQWQGEKQMNLAQLMVFDEGNKLA